MRRGVISIRRLGVRRLDIGVLRRIQSGPGRVQSYPGFADGRRRGPAGISAGELRSGNDRRAHRGTAGFKRYDKDILLYFKIIASIRIVVFLYKDTGSSGLYYESGPYHCCGVH